MALIVKPKKSEMQAPSSEMTMEEARAYRASLYQPKDPELTEIQKREEFRKFWVSNKKKYGAPKNVEKALWMHLTTIGKTSPEDFQEGLKHFGLIEVK